MKIVLLATTSLFALCVSSLGPASAAPRSFTHSVGHARYAVSASPGSVTLYDQYADIGLNVSSQNFEASYAEYDSAGADDFTVPAGHTWKIKEVDVSGFEYDGDGPADSENVTFYDSTVSPPYLPNNIIAACIGVQGIDNFGPMAIAIPKTCKAKLKGGQRYWVSVVANMHFFQKGQWFWNTRNPINAPGVWENPANGFGTGCTTWTQTSACQPTGDDYSFLLKGKDVVR